MNLDECINIKKNSKYIILKVYENTMFYMIGIVPLKRKVNSIFEKCD